METRARLKTLRNRIFSIHGRQARAASFGYNLFKTLLQSAVMWLVFLVTGPLIALAIEAKLGLQRFHFPAQFFLAAFIFVGSALIAGLSAYTMVLQGSGTPLPVDSTRQLVVAGPYRYIRNPMAFASLMQGAAVGVAFGSPLILLYILVGVLLWNFIARPWEEADLERKFGVDYLHYKENVRCWAPRLRPYCPDSHVTASRSTITAAGAGAQIPFDRITP